MGLIVVACGGSTEGDGGGGAGGSTGGSAGGGGSGGSVGGNSGTGAASGGSAGSGGIAGSGAASGGTAGVGASGGVAGVGGVAGSGGGTGGSPAGCAGLSYCDCTSNAACQVVAEDCHCPCGVEPCAPNCACKCSGGKYLGCAPTSVMNPGALEGLWLVGWSGGANHFSWIRIDPGGKAVINDGKNLNANIPFWDCNGAATWFLSAKIETLGINMPSGCNPGFTTLTFDSWVGKPAYPKDCLLLANVSEPVSSLPLLACRFPSSYCDAAMKTCKDPL